MEDKIIYPYDCEIPVSSICLTDPRQVTEVPEDLLISISAHGILTRIRVVDNEDGTYELISGFRRVYACKNLGLLIIPVTIICTTKQLEARIERKDELRAIIIKMIDVDGMSPVEIAKLFGLTESWVKKFTQRD